MRHVSDICSLIYPNERLMIVHLYIYIYTYWISYLYTFFGVKTKNLSIFRRCIYIYIHHIPLRSPQKKPEPKTHAPRCLSSPRYVPAAARCGQRNILVEVAVRDGWRICWEFWKRSSKIIGHLEKLQTCWKHLKYFLKNLKLLVDSYSWFL